jgi:transcriptional regulator with XRE-family HTH domain
MSDTMAKTANAVNPNLSNTDNDRFGEVGHTCLAMNRLTDILQQVGVTPSDLAKRIGVSPSTVWKWTSGRRLPRTNYATAIAAALNIAPHALHMPVGSPARASGLADQQHSMTAPRSTPELLHGSQIAALGDAVAAMLAEAHLPRDPGSLVALSRRVETEVLKLGRTMSFEDRLGFVLSEERSRLQRKWAAALQEP